jgi:hypothetical protein
MIRLSSCWGAKMSDELGTEFSAACNKLRRVLQEKTGDGRLRDLEAWLDYDGKSVFIAALWSDDEASVAVRFQLSVPISAAEFDPQMFIRAAEEVSEPHHDRQRRTASLLGQGI